MADAMEPNAPSLTGVGVSPNRVDNFASAFGAPGIPPPPPQAMSQGTTTESPAGNSAAGATELANRLGVPSSQPMNEQSVAGNPITGEPTVSEALLDELQKEKRNSNPPFSANGISEAPASGAAAQPVSSGITPDMGGVAGEPQVPAESPVAVGGDTNNNEGFAYNELAMNLLKEVGDELKSTGNKLGQAIEEIRNLRVKPADVSASNESVAPPTDAPKEPELVGA